MSGSERIAAAVSEVTNALQVALPAAARIRERLDEQTQDAERLEAALTRATEAIRHLRPSPLPTKGAKS